MSKITNIIKSQSVDYSTEELEFFINYKESSDQNSAESIIASTKSTIYIATTNGLTGSIIKEINMALKREIRVYLLFKDFSGLAKETIKYFTNQNPVVIRECPDLENDFVIIDKQNAFLFCNSLNEIDNEYINLNLVESKELFYIFNHLFWDKSFNEQIAGLGIAPCSRSPYPPFYNYRGGTKHEQSISEIFSKVIVPQDSSYRHYKNKTSILLLKIWYT